MYNRFWVLVTEEHYGVFSMEAGTYPDEMLENLDRVCVKYLMEVESYLLEKVGRNVLIRGRFSFPKSIGELHNR